MNIILNTYQEIVSSEFNDNSYQFISGIAVKLTELTKIRIELREILDSTNKLIIIDAEFDRLDFVIEQFLENQEIHKHHLSRILVTVQARRDDARDQLINLQNLRVDVVLVAGNNAYISNSRGSISKKISDLYTEFSHIRYLGVSNGLLTHIERHLGKTVHNDYILGLYGESNRTGTSVWAYTYQNEESESLKGYISRRNTDLEFNKARDKYSINIGLMSSFGQFQDKTFLFLDTNSKTQFLNILSSDLFH